MANCERELAAKPQAGPDETANELVPTSSYRRVRTDADAAAPRVTAGASAPMRSLLRSLLRAHRGLPGEMRKLGDKYVMKEFKDTRDVTKPEHLAAFRGAWEHYHAQLRAPDRGRVGDELSEDTVDSMSDEQRNQLIELRLGAQGKK